MKTRSTLIYILLGLVTALGFYLAQDIEFDTDADGYSLASNEDQAEYNNFQKNFPPRGSGERIIILENQNAWNSYSDFTLLQNLVNYWENQSKIERVTSITNLDFPHRGVFVIKNKLFLDLQNEDSFNKRFQKFDKFNDVVEKFLSKDKKYALLYINTKDNKRFELEAMNSFKGSDLVKEKVKVHFLEYDVIQSELRQTMRSDAVLLAVISIALILISFYILTKSFRGLLLITLVVAFNLACTLLFMYALEISFSIHMITIPCIVIVLSFTDIMHVLYHQQMVVQDTLNNQTLRQKIIKQVKSPMLVTSLTNVVGFFVFFILAENDHLFNFSLVAIVGVLIAYLNTRFIIIHTLNRSTAFIYRTDFAKLNRAHALISERIKRRKNAIQIGLSIACVATLVVIGFLFKIDSSEGDLIAKETPQTIATGILKNEFFGSKRMEISIQIKEGSFWSSKRLKKIENLEKEISEIFNSSFVNSPTLVVKRFHRFMRNGHPGAFTIPDNFSEKRIKSLDDYYMDFGGKRIISEDKKMGRIVFGFNDSGLESSRKQYSELKTLLAKYSNDDLSFKMSGKDYIADEGTYFFTLKILFGLGIGVLFSSFLTFFIIKSMKESLGLILVNLFPVLVTLAIMLLAGIAITPLTLFFLSILVGICVDDSIYVVTQKDKSKELHIFPIFVTSIVLAVGFIALGFSNFQWIRPFAWIFLVGIAIAYVMDLFILPLFFNRNTNFGKHG